MLSRSAFRLLGADEAVSDAFATVASVFRAGIGADFSFGFRLPLAMERIF